jgi:hypothetical protein
MSRARRDRNAERTAICAAADRLLAGIPLRSTAGSLTGTEPISECGLRRDVVYRDHKDLIEEFQARARAQQSTPLAVQDLTTERDNLASELASVRDELAQERAAAAVLRRISAELALELDHARNELVDSTKVTRLPL